MNALYMAAVWWACVSVVVQVAAASSFSSSSAMVSLDDIWARATFQVQDGIWRVKWDRRQRHHIPREKHHISRILIHPSTVFIMMQMCLPNVKFSGPDLYLDVRQT